MKRTFKYALTAVLASAIAGMATAQSNFPDVPENHWAYEALARMKKEGLLMGYPDGLYRGPRAATRYELAVAMHAVWMNLKTVTDGLDQQIKALESKDSTQDADIANLKAAVDQLKADVASIKGWGDDIAALKRAVSTFESEFKSMGVDIEKMKKDLADLGDRVTALEKAKLPFTVSGDLNFVGLGGYSSSGNFGLDTTGRLTGIGHIGGSQFGNKVGATRDLTLGHEFALSLKGNADKGPQWGVTTVISNLGASSSNNLFGNQSTTPHLGYQEAEEAFYIHDAWVKFNSSLASLAFNATVGRQGEKISPWIYQRADTTPFFENERWDNGEYTFDGAKVSFAAGPAKLSIFGGRTAGTTGGGLQPVAGGNQIQPLTAGRFAPPTAGTIPIGLNGGAIPIDQQLGVTAAVPIGDKGSINLAYLWLDSDTYVANPVGGGVGNRVEVYGVDGTFDISGVGLNAGYSKSDVKFNNHNIVNKNNDAYWATIKKDWDRWGAKVGYAYIAPDFGAPGTWGRFGTYWNPVDVKGWNAAVHFDLTEALRLWATGQWWTGVGKAGVSTLSTSDKLEGYEVGLDYKFAQAYTASLSYEDDTTKGPNLGTSTGNPVERWYNIGLGWSLSDNAKLKFLWQISDHDLKGYSYLGSNTFKGGLISTQLSLKF